MPGWPSSKPASVPRSRNATSEVVPGGPAGRAIGQSATDAKQDIEDGDPGWRNTVAASNSISANPIPMPPQPRTRVEYGLFLKPRGSVAIDPKSRNASLGGLVYGYAQVCRVFNDSYGGLHFQVAHPAIPPLVDEL